MLLAPVIVDLGPDVGAREAQIVLDACNDAIASGACVPETAAGAEPARAIAVARATDRRVLVVRIEVRLRAEDEGSPIVRELHFARRDPLRERWRSVGLAIATLVGEGEEREREQAASEPEPAPSVEPAAAASAEPEPAASVEPAQSAEPARRAPAESAPRSESVPQASPSSDGALPPAAPPSEPDAAAGGRAARPRARVAFEHRPVFVGVGVLGGPGFGAGAWRVGGQLRGGWQSTDGWQLATSLGFAWRTSEESFTASWMSLDAGLGYRFAISDAVDLGALLFGGIERARFEVLAGGVSRSEARWNARFGLGLDARWRASEGFGVWAALEGSSSGRSSRLFIAPDRDPIRGSALDVASIVGVSWWLE